MSLLLLILLATGVASRQEEEQVLHVALQRDTVSAVSCPVKTTEQVTWTELEGAQRGVPWGNHLIFTNVQGPGNQLYRCQATGLHNIVTVYLKELK